MNGFASTPAKRQHIFTSGQRINVTAITLYALGQGFVFTLSDPARFNSVSFEAILEVAPIHWWGGLYLSLGLALLVAYRTGHYIEVPLTLIAGAQAVLVTSFVIAFFGHLTPPLGTLFGVFPHTFIAASAFASVMSTGQARRQAEAEYEQIKQGTIDLSAARAANDIHLRRTGT